MGVSCIRSILYVFPSDLPGVNPATLNGMILDYRLMTKWIGLGNSTELSRVGLSQYTTPSRLPVKFGAFASPGFRCKSLIISLSLRDIVSVIHYDVTICMKLDPGIHIGSIWFSFKNQV
jgi:hypothetical protein